ncbi:hypothetical protein BGW36DRAFT_304164 [Talaromyces proteolyticus]|uniref:Uncharacterized protein n=1 Tax=Talaromyces proteolyticus TaxID=1131652 RepID=A0AAD4KP48_9EURO|nr:uncharacterized protein BGW36DRAFT_304164 [Talaromyces proteolyticus]KAH8692345.1 hypothetical protein BGW36DRAFT_304164 [Talaromyces proteolyticus]
MDGPSFIFLNTTNTPNLSPQAAKQMRGHITKSNFAKRRQRLITSTTPKGTAKASKPKKELDRYRGILIKSKFTTSSKSDDRAIASSLFGKFFTTPSQNNTSHHEIHGLILLSCVNPPGNPHEAAWVEFIVSDPALIEASMAVGARHWSPQPSWQLQADLYSSRALEFIIRRIGSRETQTDGFLGTVLTMAFAERLMHSSLTWGIHIDGLVQIIQDRRAKGINMPAWFYDLLVLDVTNYIFDFPRIYHKKIIDALGNDACPAIVQVASIPEDLIALKRSIDSHQPDSEYEIDASIANLHNKVQALLKKNHNEFVWATAQTIELIIYLLWPLQQGSQSNNLNILAEKLKETLEKWLVKPCPYMDLTSCQLIIGAIAAKSGTSTRTWFVNKLTNAARAMRSRGWNDPFEVLEMGMKADRHMATWFRILSSEFAE